MSNKKITFTRNIGFGPIFALFLYQDGQNFMKTDIRLPKQLGNCPLVDALIEIRFTSALDRNAVFGYIYGLIKDSYPSRVINLPISQIPAQVRDNDPNLQFKPLYRLEGKDTILQLGPDVICLSSKIPYIGWDNLSRAAENIFEKLSQAGAIQRVLRLGHRYVNFFEGNIEDKLNMSVKFVNKYQTLNMQIRSEVCDGNFINTLQYSNSAVYRPTPASIEKKGSLIDIDTFRMYDDNHFLENISNEINAAHSSEKALFYSLLKDSFILDLNPEY